MTYPSLMCGSEPLPGILASGQPQLSQLQELAATGLVAIIDLRGENEDRGYDEATAVTALGMRYVSLPVTGAHDLNDNSAQLLDQAIRDANGPVLIHCGSALRVGALLALRQRLIGEDAESALATGIKAGLSSPDMQQFVWKQLTASS